jgi:hypothetical protein
VYLSVDFDCDRIRGLLKTFEYSAQGENRGSHYFIFRVSPRRRRAAGA